MNLTKLKEEIRRRYYQYETGPLEWVNHVEKVYLISEKLCNLYGINKETVLTAAILHDIGVFEQGYVKHSIRSSEMARTILTELGEEKEFIEKVVKIIRDHHNYKESCCQESLILKTSDVFVMLSDLIYTTYRYILFTRKNNIPLKDMYKIIVNEVEKMKKFLKESPYKSGLR